ncbi:MAG: hypothetical protein AAGH99_10655 [Planctomycetota bacterium]
MAWNYPLLDRIAAGGDAWLAEHPSVEMALGMAWESSDPRGRRRIVSTLLSRRQPEGLTVMIEHLHELDSGSRAELARQVSRLQKPLRLVLSGASESTKNQTRAQINALLLVEAAAAGGLAYLVVEKLRSTDEPIRNQAERCLLGMVKRVSEMEAADGERLTQTINEAIAGYARHRSLAVIRAWLGLAPRGLAAGGKAIEALQDTEHAAVAPMRDRLKSADGQSERGALVAALALPTLDLAAVHGLRRCFENGTWGEAIAGHEHLLNLPAVRRGLARAGEPGGLFPASLNGQSDSAIAALPAWICALPISPLEKARRLGLASKNADERSAPLARLNATRELIALTKDKQNLPDYAADPRLDHEVRRQLLPRLEDSSIAIARLAATHLVPSSKNDAERNEILTAMSRSKHASIRTMAGRRLRASAFDRLWNVWPQLNDKNRLRAARATLNVDPLAARRLESHLKRGGSHRTRALEIVTSAPDMPTLKKYAGLMGGAA